MGELLRSLNQFEEVCCLSVFPSPKTEGRLVDVKFRFDKAKRAAELKDFRFHDLRHTAATRMADGGANAFASSEWRCVTLARLLSRSAEQLKTWSSRLDLVSNR